MNKFFASIIAVAALAVATPVTIGAQSTQINAKYRFNTTNPLATGRWVKISINGSGMYEISHDKLREMGFSNPELVSVYGTGGQKRSHNFHNQSGTRQLEDVIQAVPVAHYDNKLVFYGQGDRVLKFSAFNSGSSRFPRFTRESLNTYSETTYYMLTDSKAVKNIEKQTVNDKGSAIETTPYGYVYHEAELFNGPNDSGENWLGEKVSEPREVSFDIEAPYCTPDQKAFVYTDVAVVCGYSGQFTISLNGGNRQYALKTLSSSTTQSWESTVDDTEFTNVNPDNLATGKLKFTVSDPFPAWDLLAIDYWTVVYPSSFTYLDNDPSYSQFTAGFNHLLDYKWKHHLPSGSHVWDITSPLAPKELDSDGQYFYSESSVATKVVAFNPSRPLMQIGEDYEVVANQDLHAMQQNPYDMLIITMPELKKYADRIAELHAQYDGQRVAVVLSQDTFNEFNAGTPDAMCYRMMAKMLFQHPDRPLKNILFLGPLHGDYRNIRQIPNRRDGMIAFQDNNSDFRSISNPNMDFYGIMADYIRYLTRLESAPISLGVGILPIDNDQDAELAIDKIRAHLEKKDFSGIVNETYTIGCPGDGHIHENQSIRQGQYIQNIVGENLNTEFAHESLWLEGVNSSQGRDLIQNAMRRGKAFINYFGHAVLTGFNVMTLQDAMTAGNNEQGVAFFAGCDLVVPDRGEHGMGDMPVIRSRNGFIGIVSATRSVLSNHNESLAHHYVTSMFYDGSDKFRTSTPTTGEIYAGAKDRTSNNSEMAYVYVGDPALRVPVALNKVTLNIPERRYRAGETVEVTGQVVDNKTGNVLTDYNGYVTIKLMEPTRMVVTPEPTNGDQKMLDYAINDLPIIAVNGPVKDGRFSLKVLLPELVESFMSDDEDNITNLLLLAGTYNPDTFLGGSGRVQIPMAVYGSEPDAGSQTDTTAPVADIEYDPALGVIRVTASDDVAIRPGIGPGCGISLWIDGTVMSLGQTYSSDVCVTSYTGSVDMARLTSGTHNAHVAVTDLAGNTTEKSLSFKVVTGAALELTADGSVAIEEMSFSLRNGDGQELSLLVTDRNGKTVSETEVSGSRFSVDTSDLNPGTYRAYVHRDTPEGARMHSNQVEFTVIK